MSNILNFTDAVRVQLARKIEEQEKTLRLFRNALRFYASGQHINTVPVGCVEDIATSVDAEDEDTDVWRAARMRWNGWIMAGGDTVQVEAGTVAAAALRGESLDWSDDEPEPIAGER